MLDHIVVLVSDLDAASRFYGRALEPLGMDELMRFPGSVGYGAEGKPWFWIREGGGREPVHVAFSAPDRPTVDAFYNAALEAGGRDNGGPGVRGIYHPAYYGAYVLDPDGHNIEAVCHRPPEA